MLHVLKNVIFYKQITANKLNILLINYLNSFLNIRVNSE